MSEVIVITSGKGGVGKTTTTANVGTGLAMLNKKVVMIDTDIGLRNLDVVLGLENRIVYNLVDVVEEKCRLKQALIKHKKGAKILDEVINSVVKSYSYVTAIIFTLCCPVYVSYYVIIIGCLASTGIKHLFGGFGRNIFNPAIIGRIFTGVAFAGQFLIPEEYVDVMSSSTVTSQYSGLSVKWLSEVLPEGFNMGNLLIGNYVGAMGETFTLLFLVLAIK